MAFRLHKRLNSRWRLVCVTLLLVALAIAAQLVLFGFSAQVSLFIAGGGVLMLLLQHWAIRPLQQEIIALNLHAQNLQDGSFNTGANQQQLTELLPLAETLNQMSAQLRHERASLYQRELLLDTVLQSSPSAMLLTDEQDRVLMANPAARQLLSQGSAFTGSKLQQLTALPEPLFQALCERQQGLLRLNEPEPSVWHLSVSQFTLNQQWHWLYLLKPLTRELQREELNAWKKLLRVIGHELNNTLAPLSSLAFSGKLLAERHQLPELQRLFDTISERSAHLNQFVQAYIRFAKLPPPAKTAINWPALINQLQDQYEFELDGALPAGHWQADPQQLSQLLLNLLKNAHESGSMTEHIRLQISEETAQLRIELTDGGGGLSEHAMQHVLVPFFTTKDSGSGIGLTLCRDIAQAHGGSLQLENTAATTAVPAGLRVSLLLPA